VPLLGQRQHGTHRGRSSHRDGHQHHPQPETFRSAHGDDTQPHIHVDHISFNHSWCGPCQKMVMFLHLDRQRPWTGAAPFRPGARTTDIIMTFRTSVSWLYEHMVISSSLLYPTGT
jgi:hypothetical protein